MRRLEPSRGMHRAGVRRGFTLIELLVVMVIASVLLALVLAQLGRSRVVARRADAHAQLASSARAIWAYSADYREVMPTCDVTDVPWGPIRIDDFEIERPWFYQSRLWIWPAREHLDTLSSLVAPPFDQRSIGAPTRFLLTATAHASPTYWVGASGSTDARAFAPVRQSDVVSPSAKIMLLDHRWEGRSADGVAGVRANLARFDGSARVSPFYGIDERPDLLVSRPFGAVAWMGMTTIDGVRGRDAFE